MTEKDVLDVSRRRVLKHTGAATCAISLFSGSGSTSEESKKTRLLESAIVYKIEEDLDETDPNTFIRCPSGGYRTTDNEIIVPPSPNSDSILSMLTENDHVVNFGGLQPLNSTGFGGMPTRHLTNATHPRNKTQSHEILETGDDHLHQVPQFKIIPKSEKSVVKVRGSTLDVQINDVNTHTLDSIRIPVSVIDVKDVKAENEELPDKMLSKEYEMKSKELPLKPEIRVKDYGELKVKNNDSDA